MTTIEDLIDDETREELSEEERRQRREGTKYGALIE